MHGPPYSYGVFPNWFWKCPLMPPEPTVLGVLNPFTLQANVWGHGGRVETSRTTAGKQPVVRQPRHLPAAFSEGCWRWWGLCHSRQTESDSPGHAAICPDLHSSGWRVRLCSHRRAAGPWSVWWIQGLPTFYVNLWVFPSPQLLSLAFLKWAAFPPGKHT